MGICQFLPFGELPDDLLGNFLGREPFLTLLGEDDFILGSRIFRGLSAGQTGFFRQLLAVGSEGTLDLVIRNNHTQSLCLSFRQMSKKL